MIGLFRGWEAWVPGEHIYLKEIVEYDSYDLKPPTDPHNGIPEQCFQETFKEHLDLIVSSRGKLCEWFGMPLLLMKPMYLMPLSLKRSLTGCFWQYNRTAKTCMIQTCWGGTIYVHMYVYIYIIYISIYICTARTYAEVLISRCVALRMYSKQCQMAPWFGHLAWPKRVVCIAGTVLNMQKKSPGFVQQSENQQSICIAVSDSSTSSYPMSPRSFEICHGVTTSSGEYLGWEPKSLNNFS